MFQYRAMLAQLQTQENHMFLEVTGAFRNASDVLIAVKKQRAVREQQEKVVAAAQDATRLVRIRYQGGAISYLEVLITDSSLFTAQLNLVNSREGEVQCLLQLYGAHGEDGINAQSSPAPFSFSPSPSRLRGRDHSSHSSCLIAEGTSTVRKQQGNASHCGDRCV
jgi:outer membrane protein TolC